MKLTDKELSMIITALEMNGTFENELDKEYAITCKKIAKEMKKRGFTTLVSRDYLKEE
jgi:hypothetical protein